MLGGHEFCTVLDRQVSSDADQSTEFAEAKAEFSSTAGAALRFLEDGRNTTHVEVWDFAEGVLITVDFLGDESNQASAVSSRVRHFRIHVHLVAVATDTASQRGVHALNRVQVSSGDQDEVARDRFGLGEGAARALRAARDGECALLHGGEQRLLLLEPKEVDLVNVEHALVRSMDGAWLNTLVGGRLHAT